MQNIYIFGSNGQDGSLLKTKLEQEIPNLKLFLFSKDSLKIIYKNKLLKDLKILNNQEYFEILDKLLITNKPIYIFYLAALHISSTEDEKDVNQNNMFFTNYTLISFILSKCVILDIKPKIIYASSSLIFAGSNNSPQSEISIRKPQCNYSKQKVLSEELIVNIWEKFKIPFLVPIFYNHESIRRKEKFFTKKVISSFSKKAKDKNSSFTNKITLYNPNAIIDMGYAEEYMDLLLKLTISDHIGSFIFSTGNPITVKSFVNYVLEYYELTDDFIIYKDVNSRSRIDLVGDNSKIYKAIGSRPLINGKKLVFQLCKDYEEYIRYTSK